MVESKSIQWSLRAAAALFAIAGIVLSSYFEDKTEVPETPDKEPTGFKNDVTTIHLE